MREATALRGLTSGSESDDPRVPCRWRGGLLVLLVRSHRPSTAAFLNPCGPMFRGSFHGRCAGQWIVWPKHCCRVQGFQHFLSGSALGKSCLDIPMRTRSLQHGGGLFYNVIVGESALIVKSLALRIIGEAVMAGLFFDQGGLLQIVRRVLPLLCGLPGESQEIRYVFCLRASGPFDTKSDLKSLCPRIQQTNTCHLTHRRLVVQNHEFVLLCYLLRRFAGAVRDGAQTAR